MLLPASTCVFIFRYASLVIEIATILAMQMFLLHHVSMQLCCSAIVMRGTHVCLKYRYATSLLFCPCRPKCCWWPARYQQFINTTTDCCVFRSCCSAQCTLRS